MKKKSIDLFNRLEEQRAKLVDLYNSLSSEQRAFNPQPDAWNLLQVMRHIVTAEKQSMILIQRRITKQKELPAAGIGSKLSYLILKLAMILPIKFKAPKIAEVHEEVPDFESMKQEWQEVRSDMKKILDETDEELLETSVYIHPRAGRLNMNQALGFMINHITHHLKQIRRIQNHPSFPSG